MSFRKEANIIIPLHKLFLSPGDVFTAALVSMSSQLMWQKFNPQSPTLIFLGHEALWRLTGNTPGHPSESHDGLVPCKKEQQESSMLPHSLYSSHLLGCGKRAFIRPGKTPLPYSWVAWAEKPLLFMNYPALSFLLWQQKIDRNIGKPYNFCYSNRKQTKTSENQTIYQF